MVPASGKISPPIQRSGLGVIYSGTLFQTLFLSGTASHLQVPLLVLLGSLLISIEDWKQAWEVSCYLVENPLYLEQVPPTPALGRTPLLLPQIFSVSSSVPKFVPCEIPYLQLMFGSCMANIYLFKNINMNNVRFDFSESQQLRNKYANYMLCCRLVFVTRS